MSILVGIRQTAKEQKRFLSVRSMFVENRSAEARSWKRVVRFLGGVGSGIKGHTTEKDPAAHAAHVAAIVAKYGPAHPGYEHGPGKHGIPYKGGTKQYHQAQAMIYQKGLKEGTIVKGGGKKAEEPSSPKPTAAELPKLPDMKSAAIEAVQSAVKDAQSPEHASSLAYENAVKLGMSDAGAKVVAEQAMNEYTDSHSAFEPETETVLTTPSTVETKAPESLKEIGTPISTGKPQNAISTYGSFVSAVQSMSPGQTLVTSGGTGGPKYILKEGVEFDPAKWPAGTLSHTKTVEEHESQSKGHVVADPHSSMNNGPLRASLIERTSALNLTKEEKAGIGSWTTSSYGNLNAAIRNGTSISELKTALHTSSAIQKATDLKEPITVFRGQNFDPKWNEGEEHKLSGFTATSVSRDRAFGGAVKIEFETTKGLYIEKLSYAPPEHEWLLDHGTRIQVVSKSVVNEKAYPGAKKSIERTTYKVKVL